MFESSYEINTSDTGKLLVQLLRPFGMLRPCTITKLKLPSNANPFHVQKDASLRFSRIDDVAGVRRRLPAPAHG